MENNLQPAEASAEKKQKYGFVNFIYDVVSIFATTIVIIAILFTFFVRFAGVDGNSMNPTLSDGDWLVVSTINREIKQGDIVISTEPNSLNEPIVKRVIATGGQEIDIDFITGAVYVDGVELDEPYIAEPTHTFEGRNFPLIVPEGELFLMGDNRNDSTDSRSPIIGCVDERYIYGVVQYRLLPEFTKMN